MEIKRMGHKYTVVPQKNGEYLAVMIISEHDNLMDAMHAILEAMDKESDEIMKKEKEEYRKLGVKVVSFKEAIRDLSPEERERFLEERNRKFIKPLLDLNFKMLEQMERRLKLKRIK